MKRAAASPRRAVARPARPKVVLAPMLPVRGGDADLDAVGERHLLSVLPDGWRCLVLLDDRVRIRARGGRDLSSDLPAVRDALGALRSRRGLTVLDAILCLPEVAVTSAPTLADVRGVELLDVLCADGRDLTTRPLRQRREVLGGLMRAPHGPPPDEHAPRERDGDARVVRNAIVRVAEAWRGDLRAALAQQGSGHTTPGALLARRDDSPYRAGYRSRDWLLFGEAPRAEMLLCGIAAGGSLVLGMPLPHGIALGGLTWPTRRWRTLAARCFPGPPLFPVDGIWPSLGEVTWARPDVWLAVEPDVRPGSGRGGPRWRLLRVQEDLSLPPPPLADDGAEQEPLQW